MNHNYCIIMAGGIGSRFWPVSRTNHPKQFIDILGTGETLIQQTFRRMKKVCSPENIYVVTNQEYKDLTQQQLPEIGEHQVICEPARRNTAPCIAYANFKIQATDPDANIVVTPADHLVLKEDVFTDTLNAAIKHAEERNALVTVGIKPSRPDTGYGYIKYGDADEDGFSDVIKFTEKPTLEVAKEFLESGDYSWNSGMFIWTLKSINEAMKNLLPEVYQVFEAGNGLYNTDEEWSFIEKAYKDCPDISIDYGVMEKSENVRVMNADFGWSDLGTWGSLYTHIDLDDHKNAIISGNVDTVDANNNIMYFPEGKKAIIQGADDFIIVDTEKAFLLCKKEDEQQIKQFVQALKSKNESEYL